MKKILINSLIKIVQWLTSGEMVKLAKELVATMFADNTKNGEEKRAYVLNELKKRFNAFSSALIGLVIESLVVYGKEQGLEKLKSL